MNFLNDKNKINQISEEDLIKGLEKINKENEELRKSFMHPDDCKKIRCGKLNFK